MAKVVREIQGDDVNANQRYTKVYNVFWEGINSQALAYLLNPGSGVRARMHMVSHSLVLVLSLNTTVPLRTHARVESLS